MRILCCWNKYSVTTMPGLKLVYFDGKGRGEPIKWVLAAGNVKFDSETFGFADWPARKPKTPYGSVPILYVDGKPLCQTVAIARYAGKLGGLASSDPFNAAIGDEVVDTCAEIVTKYFDNVFEKDAEKKAANEKTFWEEYMPKILGVWEGRITTSFLTEDKPTWADVFMGHWLFRLREVRADLLKNSPKLAKITDAVVQMPGLKAYLANEPKYSIPL